ncbi:MAG: hypothetical protein ACRED5_04690 [Propylenella sp.]
MDTRAGRRPVSTNLHPAVYKAMLALALWLVLSIWWGFVGGGESGLEIAIATVFIIISVGLPLVALRTWWKSRRRTERSNASFQDWAAGDFETGQGRLPAVEAAVQALLPIAAVAFGMTIFGIVGHFVL